MGGMGLKIRLILVLMIPVVLVGGVYGYLRTRYEQAQILENQRRDMARTARAVRIAVESALRDRQLRDIERLLDEMVEYQELVDRIRLFDRDLTPVLVSNELPIGDEAPVEALRRVIASGEPESFMETRAGRPVLSYLVPIRDRSDEVAAIELVQIATRAQAQRQAATRDVAVRLALLVASIAALAGLMLQRQVLRPLGRLVDGIRRLGRGEPGPPLAVERRDELGLVAEAFNEMAERLETARRHLVAETERALDLERQLRQAATLAVAGKLASSIAHEIGTPLNIISGRAEFLMKMAAPGTAEREDLEGIVAQIDRISRIIYGLLDSVRPRGADARPIAVAAAVQGFLPLLHHLARGRDVSLTTSIPAGLPAMQADPDQLQQIVMNLVLNAVDATPAGGRVVIGAREERRQGRPGIALTVSDTGAGIPPEVLPHVFDAFFTTKAPGQGTGLGLAICRHLVIGLDGEIDVRSEPGAGSTFTAWIPAGAADRP
jgi:signal transduction histidine kinase